MPPSHTDALCSSIRALLPALIRVCLHNGLSAKAFSELTREVYAEVAKDEFGIDGKSATISRVAILTGLTRKEVQRLLNRGEAKSTRANDQYNRAASVIGGWLKDRKFAGPTGHPRALFFEGRGGSFAELVQRYSGDMPPRAMLDELLRVGAIKRLRDGRIGLLTRAYVPRKGPIQKLAILGGDTADLIATIAHNLYCLDRPPRYQRKVMYDNVPLEAAEEFRVIASARGQELLEALDRWLAHRDRDVNPAATGTGRVRLGVGVYYFEDPSARRPAKSAK